MEKVIDILDKIGFIFIIIIFIPFVLIFEGLNRIFDFLADGSQNISECISKWAGNAYTQWIIITKKLEKNNGQK